ncbi:MAG: discoidin domain-containing protein, partial [Kiritimatiellaeota bacterium]|nr:discoidin domain-containing protein [Kiritimatiellota bacterium]
MKKCVFLGAVSIGMSMACQAQWFDQRLNDSAATNAFGQMMVLCDDGGYLDNNPIYAPERAFDGDVNTFYDANWAQGAWLGIKLEKPKIVTRVSYTGRQGWTGRIGGTLVQGANQSDFSDAVTLGTLNVPNANDWNGLSWRTENLPSPAALQTYTFVRLYCNAGGSYGGNFSGIEFYGCDPDAVSVPPAEPTVTLSDCVNWRFNLRWDGDTDAMMYEVQRKLDDEPDFSPIAEHYYLGTGRKEWYDASLLLFCETQYRIRALNPMGASGWTTLTNTPLNAARGAWLGTPGSYNNGGATGAAAFDGIIWTSFDAPNASDGNNAWTGLDLGAPREIVALRFLPRFDYPDRMNGGVFEAADNPDFLNATLLHTVEGTPPNTGVTEAPVPTPVTARYVRYCSPNGGWGNVAEAEFVLAPSAPNAPTGLRVESVSMMDTTNAVLTWSLSIASVVSSSKIYRATSPGGPYTCLTPDGVFGRTWTDTGLATGTL